MHPKLLLLFEFLIAGAEGKESFDRLRRPRQVSMLGRAVKQLAELIAGATFLHGDFFQSVAFRHFFPTM